VLTAGRIFLALISVLAYWSAYRYLYRAREVRDDLLNVTGPPENLPKLLRGGLKPGCFYPTARFNGYCLLVLGTAALLLLVKTLVSP